MLAKNPGFTAIAILYAGARHRRQYFLCTVANAPVPAAASLPGTRAVWCRSLLEPIRRATSRSPLHARERSANRSFAGVAAYREELLNLTGQGEPEQIAAERVTWNLFDVLGVRPSAGRA